MHDFGWNEHLQLILRNHQFIMDMIIKHTVSYNKND